MYERGQGVARDLGKARSWYAAAAEKGNVKAMHNLAVSVSARKATRPIMGSPPNGTAKPPLMASQTANTISASSPSIGLA